MLNVEQGILNVEVFSSFRNSEFDIQYSIFNASAFQGAINRAPALLGTP